MAKMFFANGAEIDLEPQDQGRFRAEELKFLFGDLQLIPMLGGIIMVVSKSPEALIFNRTATELAHLLLPECPDVFGVAVFLTRKELYLLEFNVEPIPDLVEDLFAVAALGRKPARSATSPSGKTWIN